MKIQTTVPSSEHKCLVRLIPAILAISLAMIILFSWIGLTQTAVGRTISASPAKFNDLRSTDQVTVSKNILSGMYAVPGGEIIYRITATWAEGADDFVISDTLPAVTTWVSPLLSVHPEVGNWGYDDASRTIFFRAENLTFPVGTVGQPIVITFAVQTTDSQPLSLTTYVTNVVRLYAPSTSQVPTVSNVVTSILRWPTVFLPLVARNPCDPDYYEPNNSLVQADANSRTHITLPITIDDAWFCPGDVNDYYRFEFTGRPITIQLTPPSESDYDIWVYDALGIIKAGSATVGYGIIEELVLSSDHTTTGTHYIRVYAAIPGETSLKPYLLTLTAE